MRGNYLNDIKEAFGNQKDKNNIRLNLNANFQAEMCVFLQFCIQTRQRLTNIVATLLAVMTIISNYKERAGSLLSVN